MNHAINPGDLGDKDVLAALQDCYDPELKLNIVDLGLVYQIFVSPDDNAPGAGLPGVRSRYQVSVQLLLTSPGCAAEKQIVAQIENRLAAFQCVSRVAVDVIWEPRWTIDRVSQKGRQALAGRVRSIQPQHGLVQIQPVSRSR